MTQVNHGLRSLLARARNYDLLQSLVGAEKARRTLVREYIEPEPGMRVLDIGCGTGGILAHLPRVEYVGFDLNARYIAEAIARHGSQGRFLCADVNAAPQESEGSFDRILAIALLHHLDDGEAVALMALARRLLSPTGTLITLDCCYREGQSALAHFLIDRDRGRNTRTEQGYVALARTAFSSVEAVVREDLLRIPYTHAILRCRA